MLNQRNDWNIQCQEEGWLGISWIWVFMGTQRIEESFLVVQSKWVSTCHIPAHVESGLLDSERGSIKVPHYEKGNWDKEMEKLKVGRNSSQGSVPWRNLKLHFMRLWCQWWGHRGELIEWVPAQKASGVAVQQDEGGLEPCIRGRTGSQLIGMYSPNWILFPCPVTHPL